MPKDRKHPQDFEPNVQEHCSFACPWAWVFKHLHLLACFVTQPHPIFGYYGNNHVHLWFPYFRLGLERGSTAKEAFDVIVALLEEHGQGGSYYEDAGSCHSFQSAYLIVDREEAWVLETVGKYWAAEKVTGEWCGRRRAPCAEKAGMDVTWAYRTRAAAYPPCAASSPGFCL